jgi:hypothetical protein
VTKNGYEPISQTVVVTDHQTRNFELALSRPRSEVSGVYTLTITAANDCRTPLPEEFRIRTYTATLTQQGPRLDAALSGTTFLLNKQGRGNRFAGRVEPGQVSFSLNTEDWYNYYPYVPDYYPDVVEQLPSGHLTVSGSAVATISGTRLAGTLNGNIQIYGRSILERQSPIVACRSAHHQFVLSR